MLLSQFMNASNLARDLRSGQTLAARGLDKAADALEAQSAMLRAEAERVRKTPRGTVGEEQAKASILLGVQSLTGSAETLSAQADSLSAQANAPEVGVSSRMLASALGVSINTAIKRIRKASGEEDRDG